MRRNRLSLRVLFTAALMTALLSALAVFVTAGAESGKPKQDITANESFTVENSISIGSEKRSLNRLYATADAASYVSSYGGELPQGSVAKQVYDGFYANFVTTPGNSPFVVTINPAVRVKGVDNGNVNDQGEHIIDFDATDAEYKKFCKSVNLGAVAFAYDHPEVFWIRDHSYSFSSCVVDEKDDGTFEIVIEAITITAGEAYPDAYSQRAVVNSGIAAAKNAIQTGETRYETLKNIQDYICIHAAYDYEAAAQLEASEAHTAAPLFNGTGKFVCEGYSKALKILCDQFGIPCALVSGTAGSNDEAHMWTYVRMDDGNWYAVDATWDDAGSRSVDNYFLKGSDTMSSDHLLRCPLVNGEEVPLSYPSITRGDYDPDWNQGTTDPTGNDSTTASTGDETTTTPTGDETTTTTDDETTTTTDDETTTTTDDETTTTTDDETTTTTDDETTTTTDDETTTTTDDDSTTTDSSAAETTTTTAQEPPKQIPVKLGDPDNGFVKSAELPETAKAKAGNDDVQLGKIKIIVTKLNDTEKKELSDGIRRINNSFDPDNSILEAYDIKLVDDKGNTVTITEGKLKVCLAFSEQQTKKYTNYAYSLYHQKTEGGVERVKGVKYNAKGVWFESDKFSPFGLVSVEKSGGDLPSPGTGEAILMTVIAVILLALAAGAIAFVVIRNRASSDDGESPENAGADPEETASPEEASPEETGTEKSNSKESEPEESEPEEGEQDKE